MNFRFIISYFEKYPAPFENKTDSYPSPKKRKLDVTESVFNDLDVVMSTYEILKLQPDFFRKKWKWALFIQKFLNHKDSMVKW